jgi:hypothetical protein
MRIKGQVLVVLAAVSCFAAPAPIGVVTTSGHFKLDRAEVYGNATLFDGAAVETGSASSEAILRNGVRIQLGSASSGSVTENRLTLFKGVGLISAPENFEVNAAGLSIRSATGAGRLRVSWSADGKIEVASLAGNARIATGAGAILASLPAGRNMKFALQAAAQGTVSRTGCVLYKDGRFLMQDQNTQEVIELVGPNLAASVGNRVTVTGVAGSGRPALPIASSLLNVTSAVTQSSGGCLLVAADLGAQANAPNAPAQNPPAASPAPAGGSAPPPSPPATVSKAGMSTGAKVAIVGVVAGGGAGAAIALSGGKKSTSP